MSPLVQKYSILSPFPLSKDITSFVGLIVDGVLDENILAEKARELVARSSILGGKLITKTLPYSFKTGEKVDFKARHVDKSIREIFPVDYIIDNTDKPTYQPNPGDAEFHFDSLIVYTLPKRLFTLRVTVLQDATLLGFRFPHHFVDGNSQYDLIKLYCDLVSNKTVPTITLPPDVETPLSELVQGADILPSVVRSGQGTFVDPSENVSIGLWPLLKFIVGALSKTFLSKIGLNAKDELRFIHIPARVVKQWQEECQQELDELASMNKLEEGVGLRLSKNDVITAWFLKTSYSCIPLNDDQIDLWYSFNYRPSLIQAAPETVYFHNSVYGLRIHWPSARIFQNNSLAQAALNVRLGILRNKQPSAVRKNLQFWEAHRTDNVAPSPPGYRIDFSPNVSAWTTFTYTDLDFSVALKGGEKSQKSDGKKGKVVFTQPHVAFPGGLKMRPFAFIMKDGQGDYWLRANNSRTAWKGHDT